MNFFSNHFIPNIDVKKLKLKLQNPIKLVLLDIRTPEEWKETGLIPGSLTLPMQLIRKKLDNGLLERLIDKEIVIICRSGNRSSYVTSYLRKYYGLNCVNLQGGILDWYAQNYQFEEY